MTLPPRTFDLEDLYTGFAGGSEQFLFDLMHTMHDSVTEDVEKGEDCDTERAIRAYSRAFHWHKEQFSKGKDGGTREEYAFEYITWWTEGHESFHNVPAYNLRYFIASLLEFAFSDSEPQPVSAE